MVTMCLLLHNMCIIFGYNFWKNEWMQETTTEVHNGMSVANVVSTSRQERLTVTNHALNNLAAIDDNNRKTLDYHKLEATKEFQIAMGTGGKTYNELCVRRNEIAKNLWMAKTKVVIAQTFPMDTN
jgi:hypothetical protein